MGVGTFSIEDQIADQSTAKLLYRINIVLAGNVPDVELGEFLKAVYQVTEV